MTNEKSDLSIHVRRMKFMQRGQSPQTNQMLSENTRKVITSEHWELDIPSYKPKESKFLLLESYKDFIDLRYGRMSFQGFNKTTEKMMKAWNNEEESEEEKSDSECSKGSISDEEMAERYTTLVGSIAKKYRKRNSGGRYHNKNVPKVAKTIVKTEEEEVPAKRRKKNPPQGFMKPEDD